MPKAKVGFLCKLEVYTQHRRIDIHEGGLSQPNAEAEAERIGREGFWFLNHFHPAHTVMQIDVVKIL